MVHTLKQQVAILLADYHSLIEKYHLKRFFEHSTLQAKYESMYHLYRTDVELISLSADIVGSVNIV